MSRHVLHFTLGPVQGFVAQARRTRDLWGGSFLLSWLSGQAMKAVIEHGGTIIFPRVTDNDGRPTDALLRAIMDESGDSQIAIGSLPNRFKAQVAADFDPKLCRKAVLDAWQRVADTVFETFLAPVVGQDSPTEAIWRRQVTTFWETAWVKGEDPGDGSDNTWLDARKNWRSHRPSDEGGDHCTIMGEWQELSGYIRARQSAHQDSFWDALRQRAGISSLDLRPGERLCAIALIKRLFPRVARQAIGWPLDTVNWPSTSYMAAVPWIRAAWDAAQAEAEAYAEAVRQAGAKGLYGERATEIACLSDIPARFRGLDGRMYYPHLLDRANDLLADGHTLGESLNKLHKATLENGGEGISSFYALLLMDGDRLGALLRTLPPSEVSQGLGRFTRQVPDIVAQHNGVTIYAGGDDVLALLPLPDALSAAEALCQAYRQQFPETVGATISAAIVYAHQTLPLLDVLAEAHHQLDVVAKEGNGRDSLAVSVLKGGTRNCQWVTSWPGADEVNVLNILRELVDEFRQRPEFSSRMLYVLRDRFGRLLDAENRLLPGLDPVRLLAAEFLTNAESQYNVAMAELQAGQLVDFCRMRLATGPSDALQPDGALLVRFLATNGREE